MLNKSVAVQLLFQEETASNLKEVNMGKSNLKLLLLHNSPRDNLLNGPRGCKCIYTSQVNICYSSSKTRQIKDLAMPVNILSALYLK